jgi:hypothetical protein
MEPKDIVKNILTKNTRPKFEQLGDNPEKNYIPRYVNKALSYNYDCLLWANAMNCKPHLDKKLQYDFFINTIRSRKNRPYVKWEKSEKNDDIESIKKAYGFSDSKALEALRLLSKDDIKKLKEQTDIGGLGK